MTLGRTLLMADEQVLRAYHLMVTYNVWLDDVRYYSTEDFSDFLEKLNFYTQHHEALDTSM